MNGYELVNATIKMRPQMKILMMTGHPTELPPTSALSAREIRTLAKPFQLESLLARILDMLSRP